MEAAAGRNGKNGESEKKKNGWSLCCALFHRFLMHWRKRELHKTMPLDFHEERSEYAPLEAFGRSMLGIAPWLEAEGLEEEEEKLQAVWRKKALRCLDAATDPESADFMNFTTGGSPLWIRHSLPCPCACTETAGGKPDGTGAA